MKKLTTLLLLLTVCVMFLTAAPADTRVSFLLPINYFCIDEAQTESTQEQLDAYSKDGLLYEFTGDGQILCTVTDQAQALQAVLLDMETTFAEAQDPANSMYAKSFRKLEYNADLTAITVICNRDEWGFTDSFYSMLFLVNARDYQRISGIPDRDLNCDIKFVDEAGEVIETDSLAYYLDNAEEDEPETVPAEPSSSGNGLMPEDRLLRLIKWIDDGYYRNKTYEEIVAFAGVEGLDQGHRDTSMTALGDHYFDWISDSDATHYIHVCFRGRDESGRFEAGQWNTSGIVSANWKDVDLTDWLVATACTDTAETVLEIQRFSNPLVTVTAQLPAAGWNTRVSGNTAYFYNERGESNNDPRVEVITFDDPAMFDFSLDVYDNVQPAESRVIAGVEMRGRTYHFSGWDWTEYSAQLSPKVSVGIRVSRINCNPGTEGGSLLDSMVFTWTEEDGTAYTFPGSSALSQVTPEPAPAVTPEPVATEEPAPAVTEVPAPAADTPEPAAQASAPEAGPDDYTGVWYSTWMNTGMMTGDPRSMFGLTLILTLNGDGTGDLDYFGSDGGGVWGTDEEGVVRYWGERTPLSFLEDGSLCYGTALSGYILFSRDQSAEAGVFPEDTVSSGTAEPAPEPAELPTADVSGDFVSVKYVGKTYMAGGVSMDASVLGGEYAITLNADGTVTFIMAGLEMPAYNWKQAEDSIEVDANGLVLMTLTPQADGTMMMDYSGAFTLLMEPC
ncbi:MAG: hypothetical protein MJ142_04530 [Clostridia bacterium]|nr:hypothetical protein [Clostridia bacterium]